MGSSPAPSADASPTGDRLASSFGQGSRSGRLHRLLLFWVALSFVLFWLPLVRSIMDGATYEWGVMWWGLRLGGTGLEGDLWYLAMGVALGIALLWSGSGDGVFFRWVTPAWMILLLSQAVHLAVTTPEGFVFHGDTLGVRLNLTWIAPTFHAAGLLLFGWWLLGRLREGERPGARTWDATHTRRVLTLAALLPIQFVLLRFGEPHGATDAVGVVITMGQWLAVPWALGVRRAHPDRR